jgi:DNA-binding protein YbaB
VPPRRRLNYRVRQAFVSEPFVSEPFVSEPKGRHVDTPGAPQHKDANEGVNSWTGEAADGLVRAEVDRTGNLLRLTIDSKAMRLAAVEIAEAGTAAVKQAQAAARAAFEQSLGGASADGPTVQQLKDTMGQVAATADRQFTEISTLLGALTRRADGLS